MKRIRRKHSLAVRWFHWLNFPLLTVMIWSGLLIYWANGFTIDGTYYPGAYRVGVGSLTLYHFFPRTFYESLGLERRLAEGMAWHFLFMWFFTINGVVYVLYTLLSGEWRLLVPNRQSFREAWQVMLHDLHLSKVHPPPRKFNGAQQIAYTGVVLMGAGSVITGIVIYKPTLFAWLTTAVGGYEWARWEHFWLMMGYVAFFIIHIAQVIRAGWNNFRSMVSGYEVESPPTAKQDVPPAVAIAAPIATPRLSTSPGATHESAD